MSKMPAVASGYAANVRQPTVYLQVKSLQSQPRVIKVVFLNKINIPLLHRERWNWMQPREMEVWAMSGL
jgi:hypothetical protein